jgi:hypothetical protein
MIKEEAMGETIPGEDSVGGMPTETTESVVLPNKILMVGVFHEKSSHGSTESRPTVLD